METTLALPRFLTPECQEEIYVVPDILAEQVFQYLIPKECHYDEQLSTIFTPFTYAYDNTHLHGGWTLCTEFGGRRALT